MSESNPKYIKRFMHFRYACYYPEGGMNDFIGSYDSLQELFESEQGKWIFENDKQMISDIYDNKLNLKILRTYQDVAYYFTKAEGITNKERIIDDLAEIIFYL